MQVKKGTFSEKKRSDAEELSFRSDCPITCALDIFGDRWILVIAKQMLVEGMETFKDFQESEEGIATNILSAKLKKMERLGLLTKSKFDNNKKANRYRLTGMGVALGPLIVELALWADSNLRGLHNAMRNPPELRLLKEEKDAYIRRITEAYLDGERIQ